MTTDWRTTALTPLETFLSSASAPVKQVGIVEKLVTRLLEAGELYDVFFPPPPYPDEPSVIGESAEHATWRTSTMPAALAELDAAAAALDGLPATPIDSSSASTLKDAEDLIFERLEEAAKLEPPPGRYAAILAETPRETLLPRRPTAYEDVYFRRVSGTVTLGSYARRALAAALEVTYGRYPGDTMREKITRLRNTGQIEGYYVGTAGDAEVALNTAIADVDEFLATFDV